MTGDGPAAEPPPAMWRRLLWFVGLWAAGLAVTAALAYGIRLAMGL